MFFTRSLRCMSFPHHQVLYSPKSLNQEPDNQVSLLSPLVCWGIWNYFDSKSKLNPYQSFSTWVICPPLFLRKHDEDSSVVPQLRLWWAFSLSLSTKCYLSTHLWELHLPLSNLDLGGDFCLKSLNFFWGQIISEFIYDLFIAVWRKC